MNNLRPLGGAIAEHADTRSGPSVSTDAAWYVVETKRHREQVAGAFLTQRGVTSYLPRILQWPRPAVGSEIAPMFPGYLFVHASLPDQFYTVSWTPGVKAFLAFGGCLVPLDRGIIDFLRGREGADGIIRCGVGFVQNSEVRIVDGPFRGLSAVIEHRLPEHERVRVLMNLLQRETRVELPERWVRQA